MIKIVNDIYEITFMEEYEDFIKDILDYSTKK